ncbi:MAG: hypothetical protein K8F52_12035 [Candidatus Scalindua rubra]|uniref:Inositol-3-phosphate synthase n=1 Tax=Candidatus Scalindua brodae TaxID=237368 RepID=A0A0B0EIE8_9BACT|nr:MAG: Inositol-3-phosphate synthase [Candidatus Scalindua brodae]MBZ0109386.1 hypothetical protein [Candidatus Scalindua rubra]TWU34826.1 Inositol-3-phosphate synthase [Candidatus Brocadiaceae bacterium S225]
MNKIRIAIIGVSNRSSSLIHGIHYYRNKKPVDAIGLLHWDIGGYKPGEIEVVAAFDVDERKVGKDVNRAIFVSPHSATVFKTYIPDAGISVQMGRILDKDSDVMNHDAGRETSLSDNHKGSTRKEIVRILKESGAEVIVNYLPPGAEDASRFYAYCALDAGVAFVNNTSVFIANNPLWSLKFEYKNIPIIGDGFNIRFPIMATLNSVGVDIDSVRCAKLALNRGMGGVLLAASAYFCRQTIGRFTDGESRNMIEQFINDEEYSCMRKTPEMIAMTTQ